MAHKNSDCAKINNVIFQFSIQACSVFILSRWIAGIPHFCKKIPQTFWHSAGQIPHFKSCCFVIQNKTNFHTLGSKGFENKQNLYQKENFSSVVLFITIENQSNYKFKLRSPNNFKSRSQNYWCWTKIHVEETFFVWNRWLIYQPLLI